MKALFVIFVICRFWSIASGRPHGDVSKELFPLENLSSSKIIITDMLYTSIVPISSHTFTDHQRRAQGGIADLFGPPAPTESGRINSKNMKPHNCKIHSNGTYLCKEGTTGRPPYRRTVYSKNKYRNKYFCKPALEKPSVTKQIDRLLGHTRPPCDENKGTKAYSQSTTKKQSNQITSNVNEVNETVIDDYPFTDKNATSPDNSDSTTVYSTTAAGKLFPNETTTTVTTEKLPYTEPLNASLSTGIPNTAATPTIEATTILVTGAATTTAATRIVTTTVATLIVKVNTTAETLPLATITARHTTPPTTKVATISEPTLKMKYKENSNRKHLKCSSVPINSSANYYEDCRAEGPCYRQPLIVTLKHYNNHSHANEIIRVGINNTNNSNLERQIVVVPTNAVLGNQSSLREENPETPNKLKMSENEEKLTTEMNKPSRCQNSTEKCTNEATEAYTEKVKQGPLQSAESSNSC